MRAEVVVVGPPVIEDPLGVLEIDEPVLPIGTHAEAAS